MQARTANPIEPQYLLDTAALNRKYAERGENPYRYWVGSVNIDQDCLGESLKSRLYEAAWTFIDAKKKQGWELEGSLHFDEPKRALTDEGLPHLGQVTYRITGVFKYWGKREVIREEFDPAIIASEPDKTITTADAMKALGLKPGGM